MLTFVFLLGVLRAQVLHWGETSNELLLSDRVRDAAARPLWHALLVTFPGKNLLPVSPLAAAHTDGTYIYSHSAANSEADDVDTGLLVATESPTSATTPASSANKQQHRPASAGPSDNKARPASASTAGVRHSAGATSHAPIRPSTAQSSNRASASTAAGLPGAARCATSAAHERGAMYGINPRALGLRFSATRLDHRRRLMAAYRTFVSLDPERKGFITVDSLTGYAHWFLNALMFGSRMNLLHMFVLVLFPSHSDFSLKISLSDHLASAALTSTPTTQQPPLPPAPHLLRQYPVLSVTSTPITALEALSEAPVWVALAVATAAAAACQRFRRSRASLTTALRCHSCLRCTFHRPGRRILNG
mgnify:CR=1 FL=1